MSYKVNGKNLALGRLMVRGKDAEPRLKYLHCAPEGTTVITPSVIARVSLPPNEKQPLEPIAYPHDTLDKVKRPAPESKEVVTLVGGEPAVDGPRYMVPQIDQCFVEPTEEMPSFIFNGNMLRQLLTTACEVCEDSDKVMRLRYDKKSNAIRLDTYRQPGDQEFLGMMKCIKYTGKFIPGEISKDGPKTGAQATQETLVLKLSAGRKFRGEGE